MAKEHLVIWDKATFEVGIEIIDKQHQKLVSHMNKLANSVNSQQAESQTWALFIDFYDYIKVHFKTEEEYFYTLNKNDCVLHELQHKHFIEELDRIILLNEFKDNACELIYSLTDWLIHHIQVEDKKYFLQNQP
tara:strand:+ start:2671 stop:3072 length:402 start_codon:yes stop_codon:yes gene_type:complete